MVALRKNPRVAAGDRAELDDGSAAEALPGNVSVADIAFERDAVLLRSQAERARRDPVRAIGADDDIRVEPLAVERHRASGIDAGHFGAIAKLGTCGRRLLG